MVETTIPFTNNANAGLLYSPYNSIARKYGQQVLNSYSQLSAELRCDLTSRQVHEFAQLRKYLVTIDELRPFGSLMPYFIGDYLGVPTKPLDDISRFWIALYLWSVSIDKVMDGESTVTPDSHMLHSQLLSYFVESCFAYSTNQTTTSNAMRSLRKAMFYQSYSTPGACREGDVTLEHIRSGKNLLFLAIGHIIADSDDVKSPLVIDLCERFSSILQSLDDITDIHDDLERGIKTPIIENLLNTKRDFVLSEEGILDVLVYSGVLKNELLWMLDDLTHLLSQCPNRDGESFVFIDQLRSTIRLVIYYLDSDDLDAVRVQIRKLYCNT